MDDFDGSQAKARSDAYMREEQAYRASTTPSPATGMSSTTPSRELKPCPFCGGTDVFVERADYSACYVQCDSEVARGCACMARGPIGVQDGDGEDFPGEEAAIRAWNRRAFIERSAPDAAPTACADERDCTQEPWCRIRGKCQRAAPAGEPAEPQGYSVERHGNGWAIYRGRDMFHHGWNLGHLTETTDEVAALIERGLNALATPTGGAVDERAELREALRIALRALEHARDYIDNGEAILPAAWADCANAADHVSAALGFSSSPKEGQATSERKGE